MITKLGSNNKRNKIKNFWGSVFCYRADAYVWYFIYIHHQNIFRNFANSIQTYFIFHKRNYFLILILKNFFSHMIESFSSKRDPKYWKNSKFPLLRSTSDSIWIYIWCCSFPQQYFLQPFQLLNHIFFFMIFTFIFRKLFIYFFAF